MPYKDPIKRREANRVRSREWRKNNPEEARARSARSKARRKVLGTHSLGLFKSNLKRKYGLSLEQYQQMVTDQRGVCKICGKPPSGKSKQDSRLVVDHCHVTGVVRGLLCNGCNGALGLFKDNAENLVSALQYLRESSAETTTYDCNG